MSCISTMQVHGKAEVHYPHAAKKEIAELKETICKLTNSDLMLPPTQDVSDEEAQARRRKAIGRLLESKEKFKRMEEKLSFLKNHINNVTREVNQKLESVQESNRLHFLDGKVHFQPGLAEGLEKKIEEQDIRIRRLEKLVGENERLKACEDVNLLDVQRHLNKMQETVEGLAEILYELPSNVLYQGALIDFEEKQNL